MKLTRVIREEIDISREEVDRVFNTRLNELCGDYFVIDGDKLMTVGHTSHTFDYKVTPSELGHDYDVVFMACQLRRAMKVRRDALEADAVVSGLSTKRCSNHYASDNSGICQNYERVA
jgi:hypothetical protein